MLKENSDFNSHSGKAVNICLAYSYNILARIPCFLSRKKKKRLQKRLFHHSKVPLSHDERATFATWVCVFHRFLWYFRCTLVTIFTLNNWFLIKYPCTQILAKFRTKYFVVQNSWVFVLKNRLRNVKIRQFLHIFRKQIHSRKFLANELQEKQTKTVKKRTIFAKTGFFQRKKTVP